MAELSKLALAAAMALAVATPSANAEPNPVTAPDVVTALEGAYGVHPGRRRNHTKGMCALGSFVGTPEAASYSRSALFSGSTIPVVARFSLAGGKAEGRGHREKPARHGLGVQAVRRQQATYDHAQHTDVLRRNAAYVSRQDARAEA